MYLIARSLRCVENRWTSTNNNRKRRKYTSHTHKEREWERGFSRFVSLSHPRRTFLLDWRTFCYCSICLWNVDDGGYDHRHCHVATVSKISYDGYDEKMNVRIHRDVIGCWETTMQLEQCCSILDHWQCFRDSPLMAEKIRRRPLDCS